MPDRPGEEDPGGKPSADGIVRRIAADRAEPYMGCCRSQPFAWSVGQAPPSNLPRVCRHGPAELSQAAPASLRPSRLASFSQQPHERRGGGTAVWLPQPESPLCCLSSTVRRAAIAYFATRPPWGASAADAADLATAPVPD